MSLGQKENGGGGEVSIGLVGDRQPENPSQRATEEALLHAAEASGTAIRREWLPTASLQNDAGPPPACDGYWIAPGVPESLPGTLRMIRYARERGVPLLATCGGFQHMLLEFAVNRLGLADAGNEELTPDASRLLVRRLACSLVGQWGEVRIMPDSRACRIYGRTTAVEPFRCSYGLNPEYRSQLEEAGMRITGADAAGEPRIAELTGHPFFLGTLYVPQLHSSPGAPHPLVAAFMEHCRNRGRNAG